MPPILEELLSEYRSLDRAQNPQRVREILGQAAPLMNAKAEPKKWAALRSMYAKLSSNVDVDAAISAYEDALTVWDPVADRDSWATCHSELGLLLAARTVPGSVEAERVIQHLELAVNHYPYLAYTLALFYRYRSVGDLTGNWQQRVKYLNLAISQVSQGQNPADWAGLANELGIAYTEEPAGDYNQALEKRLKLHEAALAALGDTRDAAWADTCLNLAECYLFRVGGDQSVNRKQAEDYSRQALTVSVNLNHLDLKRRALLSLGRALANLTGPDSVESLHEALTMFDQARPLIDPVSKPELVANVYALEASVYLALLRAGEQQWLESLVSSCEAALRGFDPQIHAAQRRSVLQTTGESLMESGQFERAISYLEQALREGEAALARSETTSSRMESIFQLGDSSALLSYCYLKARRYEDALNALDAGKARLWNTDVRTDVPQALLSLIPEGGAALFPVFAAPEGAVIVTARTGLALRTEVVWLPHFGKQSMLQWQRGDLNDLKLGGWLNAYSFRHSQLENWIHAIKEIGSVLYQQIWSPICRQLQALGVLKGAELIWFPQGGVGVFPVHAAWNTDGDGLQHWITEDYAIRYAPSVKSLLHAAPERSVIDSLFMVLNPVGDLRFSPLEIAWVRHSLASRPFILLPGPEATKGTVLERFSSAPAVHLATHATFNVEDPFASSIVLADGNLSLAELLLSLQKQAPVFVGLSACDTAVSRFTGTPDEFLGFPGAFLDHGTRTVLAAMWSVDDAATAFLIARFYREFLAGNLTPAEALRRSQNWLRCLTVHEASDLLRELRSEPVPVGPFAAQLRSQLRGLDENLCPFAEPYYWAAFTISGQ